MLNQNNDLKKFLFANLNFIQKGICVQTEEKQLVKRCSSQLPLKQQVLLNQGCTAHLQKATDFHQEPHLFINNREGHLRYFTVRITSLILTAILEPLRQALLHLDNIISAQPVCQNSAAILKVTVCFSKMMSTTNNFNNSMNSCMENDTSR